MLDPSLTAVHAIVPLPFAPRTVQFNHGNQSILLPFSEGEREEMDRWGILVRSLFGWDHLCPVAFILRPELFGGEPAHEFS